MRWRPWRRASDGEATAQLDRLAGQDQRVERLGRELREYRRKNNFSWMVDAAIHRAARKGA